MVEGEEKINRGCTTKRKIKWNKKEIQKKVIRFDRNIFIKKMKKIIDEIIDKEEKGGIK